MDKSNLSEADIETLIKMVEERPAIWDKSCNKDPAEKKKAWREIYEHFAQDKWENMFDIDKKKYEETYQAKWKNLRDTFVRSIKSGSTQQYKYHDQLKFLLKNDYSQYQTIRPSAEAGASTRNQSSPPTAVAGPSNEPRRVKQKRPSSAKSSPNQPKRSSPPTKLPAKKKKTSVVPQTTQAMSTISSESNARQEPSPRETTVINSVSSTTDSNQCSQDSDEMFNFSNRRYLKEFSADEILEYRKQVLVVIQNIMRKKKSGEAIPSAASTSQNNCETDSYFPDVKEEYTISDSE